MNLKTVVAQQVLLLEAFLPIHVLNFVLNKSVIEEFKPMSYINQIWDENVPTKCT